VLIATEFTCPLHGLSTGRGVHALLWSGTAASAVDLNPTNLNGIVYSSASATNGTQQVGEGSDEYLSVTHALLWSGTAASAVDLNPNGFSFSDAVGISPSGNQQVGSAEIGSTGYQAMLWSGTAASAVDLNPTNFIGNNASFALGTSGTQQVGYIFGTGTAGDAHALLWSGTAASVVDLNPASLGITSSIAWGTNGTEQVGDGVGGDYRQAMLWIGTAASAVDLGALLPSTGQWTNSEAFSVDSSGNVYGIANGTFDNVNGSFAVEWSPVPEPTTASVLLIAGAGMLMHRRRKQFVSLKRLED
jgi:hypothetical protein